ncbi:hypothetical protein D3C78_1086100 [compost metagenome]
MLLVFGQHHFVIGIILHAHHVAVWQLGTHNSSKRIIDENLLRPQRIGLLQAFSPVIIQPLPACAIRQGYLNQVVMLIISECGNRPLRVANLTDPVALIITKEGYGLIRSNDLTNTPLFIVLPGSNAAFRVCYLLQLPICSISKMPHAPVRSYFLDDLTELIVRILRNSTFWINLTKQICRFTVYILLNRTKRVDHFRTKILRVILILCTMALAIRYFIPTILILHSSFQQPVIPVRVNAARPCCRSIIMPVEAMAVAVGLLDHQMLIIADVGRLPKRIRNRNQITGHIIFIAHKHFTLPDS